MEIMNIVYPVLLLGLLALTYFQNRLDAYALELIKENLTELREAIEDLRDIVNDISDSEESVDNN